MKIQPKNISLDKFINVRICTKCYLLNDHATRNCRFTGKKCSICASVSHTWNDCRSTHIKCLNCDGPHKTMAMACPKRKEAVSKIRQDIAERARSRSRSQAQALRQPMPFPSLVPTSTSSSNIASSPASYASAARPQRERRQRRTLTNGTSSAANQAASLPGSNWSRTIAICIMHAHYANMGSPGVYSNELNSMLSANNLPAINSPPNPNSRAIIDAILNADNQGDFTPPAPPSTTSSMPPQDAGPLVPNSLPPPPTNGNNVPTMNPPLANDVLMDSDMPELTNPTNPPTMPQNQEIEHPASTNFLPPHSGKGSISPTKQANVSATSSEHELQFINSQARSQTLHQSQGQSTSRVSTPLKTSSKTVRSSGNRRGSGAIQRSLSKDSEFNNLRAVISAREMGLKFIVPALTGKSCAEAYYVARRNHALKYMCTSNTFPDEQVQKMIVIIIFITVILRHPT